MGRKWRMGIFWTIVGIPAGLFMLNCMSLVATRELWNGSPSLYGFFIFCVGIISFFLLTCMAVPLGIVAVGYCIYLYHKYIAMKTYEFRFDWTEETKTIFKYDHWPDLKKKENKKKPY